MNKTTNYDCQNAVLVTDKQLASRLNCGVYSARALGEKAQAIVRIGQRRLFHMPTIEKYLAEICE